MLAKSLAMGSSGRQREGHGAAGDGAADESYAEQTRRRAARWHAWLKSPQCTFQDRENFERWCADVSNAAAYVALCGDLAAVPGFPADGAPDADEWGYPNHAFASLGQLPRLEADQR